MSRSLVFALLFPVWPSAHSSGGLAPSASCLAADAYSANLIAFVTSFLASSAPSDTALRTTLSLNNVNVTQVTLVTTTADCAKAAAALDGLAGKSNPSRAVYLIKAGSKRYFVQDPTATAGEHRVLYVLDNKFRVLHAMLGG